MKDKEMHYDVEQVRDIDRAGRTQSIDPEVLMGRILDQGVADAVHYDESDLDS